MFGEDLWHACGLSNCKFVQFQHGMYIVVYLCLVTLVGQVVAVFGDLLSDSLCLRLALGRRFVKLSVLEAAVKKSRVREWRW